jgi:hypothetical protein
MMLPHCVPDGGDLGRRQWMSGASEGLKVQGILGGVARMQSLCIADVLGRRKWMPIVTVGAGEHRCWCSEHTWSMLQDTHRRGRCCKVAAHTIGCKLQRDTGIVSFFCGKRM